MLGNPAWPFVVKVILNKTVMPNLFRHPISLVTGIAATSMVGC